MTEEPEFNPYAPPGAEVMPAPSAANPQNYYLAGQGKRFLNYLIDHLRFYGAMALLGAMLGLLSEWAPANTLLDLLSSEDWFTSYSTSLFLLIFYYTVQEALFGRTLGKLITGTKVLTIQGLKPSLLQLVGRSAARMVPFEVFSVLMDSRSIGWHDSWSGTRVVDTRRVINKRLSPALRKH